jgi:hypothetical protein
MKILASIAIAAAAAFAFYASLPYPPAPPADEPLPPGQTNPPLRRLNGSNSIPSGARLWYRTNSLPFGQIVRCADHLFPDGQTEPGVLIRFRAGEQWIPRRSLFNSWTDK